MLVGRIPNIHLARHMRASAPSFGYSIRAWPLQHWNAMLDFSTLFEPRAENPVPSDLKATRPGGSEALDRALLLDFLGPTGASHT